MKIEQGRERQKKEEDRLGLAKQRGQGKTRQISYKAYSQFLSSRKASAMMVTSNSSVTICTASTLVMDIYRCALSLLDEDVEPKLRRIKTVRLTPDTKTV